MRRIAFHARFREALHGMELRPQIEKMQEALLLGTHIHESGVEPRHHLFDTPQKHIAHRMLVVVFLAVQLHQNLVFQQGYHHLLGGKIYYEFFIHNRILKTTNRGSAVGGTSIKRALVLETVRFRIILQKCARLP